MVLNLRRLNLAAANLSGVNLREANLAGANLTGANLTEVDLTQANLTGTNLTQANLTQAILDRAKIAKACLQRANLSQTDLSEANLRQIDLNGVLFQETKLSGVDLKGSNLTGANLAKADLSGANLSGANLNVASLVRTNLSHANLSKVQALRTNFRGAVLTGACVSDWNVNNDTIFDDIVCDYVYLATANRERRPREGFFSAGEFSALCQYTIDTIDIFFEDGIDWSAFFHAFQEMSHRCADQDFAIQAIEKKAGNAFVVRLEVSHNLDKVAIERQFRELYGEQLRTLEARYEKILSLQSVQRDETRRLIEKEREEKATLMGVIKTMANNQGPKYDFRGAHFAGGYAETINGHQFGGSINNYGTNFESVISLITVMRGQVQAFPSAQKNEALYVLDTLENNLREYNPNPQRIAALLKKLDAVAASIETIMNSAATFSDDVHNFNSNIKDIAQTVGTSLSG